MTMTVKEMIAQGVFSESKHERQRAVRLHSSTLDKGSKQTDGMGWNCMHVSAESKCVSSSGLHRSLRRAYYMKLCKPFASQLIVWDKPCALAFAARNWSQFTMEERTDIETQLHDEMFPKADHKAIAAASPFVQWTKKATEVISTEPGEAMPIADRLIEAQALLASGPVEHASPETDASIY